MAGLRLGTVEVVIYRVPGAPQFLLLQRSDNARLYPGLWQVVSGRIEPGEKAWEAALREVREETGLSPRRFYNTPLTNTFYLPGEDSVNLSPVFAAEVDAQAGVALSAEHKTSRWLGAQEAVSLLVWPGQRSAIETVVDFVIRDNPSRGALEIPL